MEKATGIRKVRAPDQTLLETLAQELLGVCMQTLKSYGLDSRRLTAIAIEAAARKPGRISRATAVLDDAQRLCEATNKWIEDPAYLDTTGRPGVLSLRDAHSGGFAALAREFFPGWSITEVVALGCKANVLERIGPDKVALINSTVLFTGSSRSILAHSIRTVRRFLCTADFNRRANAAALEGWPDRTSFVSVSDDDFREFVRIFRPQITSLVEVSNRWLFQRSRLQRNRRKKKRVTGIHAFIFRD